MDQKPQQPVTCPCLSDCPVIVIRALFIAAGGGGRAKNDSGTRCCSVQIKAVAALAARATSLRPTSPVCVVEGRRGGGESVPVCLYMCARAPLCVHTYVSVCAGAFVCVRAHEHSGLRWFFRPSSSMTTRVQTTTLTSVVNPPTPSVRADSLPSRAACTSSLVSIMTHRALRVVERASRPVADIMGAVGVADVELSWPLASGRPQRARIERSEVFVGSSVWFQHLTDLSTQTSCLSLRITRSSKSRRVLG